MISILTIPPSPHPLFSRLAIPGFRSPGCPANPFAFLYMNSLPLLVLPCLVPRYLDAWCRHLRFFQERLCSSSIILRGNRLASAGWDSIWLLYYIPDLMILVRIGICIVHSFPFKTKAGSYPRPAPPIQTWIQALRPARADSIPPFRYIRQTWDWKGGCRPVPASWLFSLFSAFLGFPHGD